MINSYEEIYHKWIEKYGVVSTGTKKMNSE